MKRVRTAAHTHPPASEPRLKVAEPGGTTIQVSDANCSEATARDREPLAKLVVDGRSLQLNRRQAREVLKELRLELSHQPEALRDAEEHIIELRKHVAELWWYGDHSASDDSVTTPECARQKMAEAAREIGMLLNFLNESVVEIADAGFESGAVAE